MHLIREGGGTIIVPVVAVWWPIGILNEVFQKINIAIDDDIVVDDCGRGEDDLYRDNMWCGGRDNVTKCDTVMWPGIVGHHSHHAVTEVSDVPPQHNICAKYYYFIHIWCFIWVVKSCLALLILASFVWVGKNNLLDLKAIGLLFNNVA